MTAVGDSPPGGGGGGLDFGSMPRTYDNALYLLSLLSTNRDVTSLFEVDKISAAGAAGAAGGAASTVADDLNSRAIPEMRAWLARAGYADPARDLAGLRCVHVAGTKGKGSVCAFVTAMLVGEAEAEAKEAGEAGRDAKAKETIGRVGTYLSPHVVSVRERIWLDGRPISRALFAQYVFELWGRLSEGPGLGTGPADPDPDSDPFGPHTKPFYFRFLTLLALHVFVREGVRSAVVECGIGGAYDATNVLPAGVVTATAVSRLGIDHVAMLGGTLAEIAWNKAGIFKAGVAAFTVTQGPAAGPAGAAPGEGPSDQQAALAVLRARARELGARALYEIPAAAVERWPGVPRPALPGAFQKYNMALAAAAARWHVRVLRGEHASDPDPDPDLDPATLPAAARAALATATLRGRCERVADGAVPGVEWLVDGAHTADSLAAVAAYFAGPAAATATNTTTTTCPRHVLLFTVRNRDAGALVRALVAGTADADVAAADSASPVLFDDALFVFPPDDAAARDAALQAMADVSPRTRTSAWTDAAAAVEHVRREMAGHGSRGGDGIQGDGIRESGSPTCRVLATGSFVLARAVLQALGTGGED